MINSISAIEQSKNVFSGVSNRTSEVNYWLGENKKDEFISIKRSRKRLAKRIGEGIAAVSILTVGAVLFVTQGGLKAVPKYAEKLVGILDKKIQKSKLENEQVSVFIMMLRKLANVTGEKFEVANNFNTIKDYSLKKILFDKTGKPQGLMGKAHNAITNMFEKIAQKTVFSSWHDTITAFEKLDYISKPNPILEKKHQELVKIFYDNFSKPQNCKRFINYKTSASQAIDEYFKEKGFWWFWHTNTLNKFIAQSAVEEVRTNYKQSLLTIRNLISQTPKDVANSAIESITKITKAINYKDNERLLNITRIERDFRDLGKTSSPKYIEEIKQQLSQRLFDLEKDFVANEFPNDVVLEVKKMRLSVDDLKPGKVEEILDIYKKILPENEYSKVEKLYKGFVKSFDKSIKLESEDYTAKVRDFLVGSAPTDILSILGGFATLGYFIAKSDNNDKRISVTLEYGIPALTTIGTVLYANTRLFAGTKSLALGIISGFVTGKICGFFNDKFLKHVENKAAKTS